MDLKNRIDLLVELGNFMKSDDPAWSEVKTRTFHHNAWFVPDFIDLAIDRIREKFLQKELLENWVSEYPAASLTPKKIGLVMAGNIPLVGFHDFLCCFISGHHPIIKLSSKDPWLLPAIMGFMKKSDPSFQAEIQSDSTLRGMDAYIATGSNNSARYFEYYFGKYPSLIRRNRTSIAILDGNETEEELGLLADDVFLYFGLGCRNVTQIYVPEGYDFVPLLRVFRKYQWMADHNKYKNNFDYRLSLAILNKLFYMSNDCLLMLEDKSPFSPIAVLHYSFYKKREDWFPPVESDSLQCVVGRGYLPFGSTQEPKLRDYADGIDTMKFLSAL